MPAHFAAVLHAVTLTDDDAAAAARALEGAGGAVGPFERPAGADGPYAVLTADVNNLAEVTNATFGRTVFPVGSLRR